jgi:hypothetical protein
MTSITSARSSSVPTAATSGDAPIEPVHPKQPEIKPYSAWKSGGWLPMGLFGLLGGGVVGLAAGGVGMLAASGGRGSVLPLALLGVGFVGGAIGAGVLTRENLANADRDKQLAAFRDVTGTSTLDSAKELVAKFDHDGSGDIQLDNASGAQEFDERALRETKQEAQDHFYREDGHWRNAKTYSTTSTVTSRGATFEAADTDPKDRKVTAEELAHLMATYDTDRSGTLTTAERAAFEAAHPAQVSTTTTAG